MKNPITKNASEPIPSHIGKNRRVLSVCVILAIITLAIFWQVRDHAFINLDDDRYITENPHVQAGITFENLKWALTTGHASNWHPLTWLSHMLDVELFGLKAGRHHLMNVFFHIVNTLLLFLILHRMTGALWQSAFVATIFALHPLHVESVAWVAERKDVLSTLFWMLTLGAYGYYVKRPGYRRYLLVIVCFILGLMSKPMLVTIPFVLLLLDFWPLGRLQPAKHAGPDSRNASHPEDPTRKKRKAANSSAVKAVDREEWLMYPLRWTVIRPLLLEKVPLLTLAVLSSIITIISQQRAMASLMELSVDARIANALVSYVKYIGKMIWPLDLAVFYPNPYVQPWWSVLGAVLILSAATVLFIWKSKRFPYLSVGWLWYLGTLVPVIGLVQVGSQAMADRYSYVPLIGIFIMIAWGVPDFLKNWGHRKTVLGVLSGIAILACAVVTWAQVQLWRDSITLFSHTLKVTTGNYFIHNNMGIALSDQRKFEDAFVHYKAALLINPKYVKAWENLGIYYEESGRNAEAIEAYEQARRLDPNDAKTWNSLGSAYGKSGQTAKALETLRQALRIDPAYDEAWNNLGNAYGGNGETAKAIEAFQQALRFNPKYAKAWNNLGIAYEESGQSVKAIEAFRQSLRISREHANVWSNLAVAYRKHGQTAEAIEAYRQALSINPKYVKAWFGLGVAYGESGQRGQVKDVYERLRAIDPTMADEFSRILILP
jgi:tetratricopeptide (TPR) repeat protein